jgi:hypothetical protein
MMDLPQDNQPVLAYGNLVPQGYEERYGAKPVWIQAYYQHEHDCWWAATGQPLFNVTRWQPLPE